MLFIWIDFFLSGVLVALIAYISQALHRTLHHCCGPSRFELSVLLHAVKGARAARMGEGFRSKQDGGCWDLEKWAYR